MVSKNCFYQDKSSHGGNAIENVTAQFGLQQIIKEPTHISNTSSSCINLTFISQSNLIIDYSVHSSLHANCYHQIVFAKLNLYIVYPTPYFTTDLALQRSKTQDVLDVQSKNLIE